MYEPFMSAVSMSTAVAVRSLQGFFKMEEKHMQKQVGLISDSLTNFFDRGNLRCVGDI